MRQRRREAVGLWKRHRSTGASKARRQRSAETGQPTGMRATSFEGCRCISSWVGQGGKREPLVVPGESRATMDPVIAQTLFAKRLAELAEARENDTRAEPIRKKPTIAEVVKEHITACGREHATTPRWTGSTAVFLGRAVAYFGQSVGSAQSLPIMSSSGSSGFGRLGPTAGDRWRRHPFGTTWSR
jgi:hypothetical protein